jgi:HEAT repeat protein
MSSSAPTFPARFAELVYLLAHQPDATVEQERVLGAASVSIAEGDASLTTSRLNVDLLDEGESVDGVQLHELVTRMSAHSTHQIDFPANTPAAEILSVARLLAGDARPNDDGAAFDDKLLSLGLTMVEVHLGRSGFVRSGSMTPGASPRVAAPSVRTPTPFRGMPAFGSATPPQPTRSIPVPPSNASARATPARSTAGIGAAPPIAPRDLTPGAGRPTSPEPGRAPGPPLPSIRDELPRIIEGAITAKTLAWMPDNELIDQLGPGLTAPKAMVLLDQIITVAEARARENRWEMVASVFDKVVRNEAAATHNVELRRAYTIGLRRLTKPTLVRGIAGLLPRRPELRDTLHDVLLRLGADGAEALIDLLTAADSLTDRRAYLAALVKCREAVPLLMHLLGDNRWYVVRNTTDLLGEMGAIEAESALIETAGHREERVRRSVATALSRLGTTRAIQTVQHMLTDAVAEVRVHAVQGLGGLKIPRAVSVLSRALDNEQDQEVQAVILAALGRQATDEAVARLLKAAEPDGRLFKRKPTALRVSAVQALAEANTPSALTALKRFADDKDREVRETALRSLKAKAAS